MKTLTKNDIEKMAREIRVWAKNYGKDWAIFYNGKKMHYPLVNTHDWHYEYSKRVKIEKDVNPRDYCEYFSDRFICGMSYDGTMYEVINYGNYNALTKILEKYGLYLEHLDSCHCGFYPIYDDMEIEYTILPERPKEYDLYGIGRCQEKWTYEKFAYPEELNGVMAMWEEYSRILGDHDGLCIIGEGVEFNYKGNKYKMFNQSIYQGDRHYRKCAEYARCLLEKLGATDICINMGRLD